MTLNDIFKNDFLDQTSGSMTLFEISLTLVIALLFGILIFTIYKKTFQGVMYSRSFNVALIILTLISATIIIGVTNNIVLSLGMVGALSIVRFRTAIKDPMDVVYMFWAIGIGIITGAGLYLLAIVACVLISAVLISVSTMDIHYEPYLLVMNYDNAKVEDQVFKLLKEQVGKYKIKSKTKVPSNYELTIEIKSKMDNSHLVNAVDGITGIRSVAMISYDGNYVA